MSTDSFEPATLPADSSSRAAPLPAAKAPVGPGLITGLGLLWSLLLIGIGVVGVQAALVAAGWLDGTSWLTWSLQQLDGLTPSAWMVPVGVLLVLLGLWVLLMAVRPRASNAMTLDASTGVFLKPADVARLAAACADQVDGVADVRASASRGGVAVRVVGTGSSAIAGEVERAVADRLSASDPPVRVSVRVSGGSA